MDSLKKIERTLHIVFILLGVLLVVSILVLLRFQSRKGYLEPFPQEEEESYNWEQGLSDSSYWLPGRCNLYETLPEITFAGRDGEFHSMQEWLGQKVVLMVWASWCDDCAKQLSHMKEYEEMAQQYGVTFLYLNRTDGERETEVSAETYFDQLGLSGELYLDPGQQAYDQMGIHNTPTTLFLDEQGRVVSWYAYQIESPSVFEAHLESLTKGNAKITEEFIRRGLWEKEGGIYSYYQGSDVELSGEEVLSESQGLMMLYAVEAGEQELFDQLYTYVQRQMQADNTSLASWKISDRKASNVNALLDDLRIYRALYQANQKWGGYETQLRTQEDLLGTYALYNGDYTDFYDVTSRKYAQRFTLCYGDLETMNLLAGRSELFTGALERARQLVEQGQISNEFPLYYSWYDYELEEYQQDDLNTSEAMVTLLNLAREGKLKRNTLRWLKAQVGGEGLMARYSVDGNVVKGYQYESTATYALVVLIAQEMQDTALRDDALRKMERMRIRDTALDYNGAFGNEDGQGISSFDQLLPLLAYKSLEQD